MEPHRRFGDLDVNLAMRGRRSLRDFFTREEVEAVCADFEKVFGRLLPINR